MPKFAKKGQNEMISKGLYRYSKSAVGRRRSASYLKLKSKGKKFPKAKAAEEPAPTVGKYYSAEDVPVPRATFKTKQNPTKLRASITPVRANAHKCFDGSGAGNEFDRLRTSARTHCRRAAGAAGWWLAVV